MGAVYRTHDTVAARVGSLRPSEVEHLIEAFATADRRTIEAALVRQHAFREALERTAPEFLSRLLTSPVCSIERKEMYSLIRFALRAGYRSTPFGLLAGVGVARLRSTASMYCPSFSVQRRASIRRLKLGAVTGATLGERCYLNPTAFPWQHDIRFMERDATATGTFRTATIERTEEIDAVYSLLAAGSVLETSNLAERIAADIACSAAEAIEFLTSLCSAGLIWQQSNTTDTNHGEPDLAPRSMARSTSVKGNDNREYFQVNQLLELGDAAPHCDEIPDCSRALPYLTLMGVSSSPEWLGFVEQFRMRYEAARVPLLEVLDPDVGIGFPVARWRCVDRQSQAPSSDREVVRLEEIHIELLRLVDQSGCKAIDLESSPVIRAAARDVANKLPPSASFLLEFPESEKDLPHILGAASTPASRWISRFAHDDVAIDKLHRELSEFENEALRGQCVAEVIYELPGRESGIACRPTYRPYTIGAASPLDGDVIRLATQDLELSVDGNMVVCWSKQLRRPVVPLLTSAHNYLRGADPVSRFLCELSHQHFPRLGFGWGPVRDLRKRLPAVRAGGFMLCPAQWMLDRKDLDQLGRCRSNEEFLTCLTHEILKRPDMAAVVLADGDNWLRFALDHSAIVETLRATLQTLSRALIVEPYPARRLGGGGGYSMEILQFLLRTDLTRVDPPAKNGTHPRRHSWESRQALTLLDGVIYLEITGPEALLDQLACTRLLQAVETIGSDCRPRSWHFVRFGRPSFHLRVRFFCDNATAALALLRDMVPALGLDGPSQAPLSWKLCGYEPELNRYGGQELSGPAHSVFCASSELVCSCLARVEPADQASRIATAVMSCAVVLQALPTEDAKVALLSTLVDRLEEDLRATSWRSQCGQLFREHGPLFDAAWSKRWLPAAAGQPLGRFELATQAYFAMATAKDKDVKGLIASHLHMVCNRVFALPTSYIEVIVLEICRRMAFKTKRIKQ